jgi:hypothetical protein
VRIIRSLTRAETRRVASSQKHPAAFLFDGFTDTASQLPNSAARNQRFI